MRLGVCRAALLAGMMAGPLAGAALAQQADDTDTVFVLGRIENGIANSDGARVGGSEVTAEDMRKFDLPTVDEAVNHVAGASASNTGGSRNERLIFVRGFDRFQTTLSIDGVRVFLPADNRIDFARFMTADLAEVQVSKGYVSVLNGPGGVGGAINLVTRRPSQLFEGELQLGATSDGDLEGNSWNASGLVGARLDHFYFQASGSYQDRDSWSLSDDFAPTNPALEDGGERGNSASNDWRVNLKAGWTPNDTDEYAISYIRQEGEKNAPYHTSDAASTRFWTWPYWDIESIYFLSRTQITPNIQLRSRVYWNAFENLLSSFDSAAQNTQTLPRAFNSFYDDQAYGANLTLEAKLSPTNALTGALHYRRDEHNEQQDGFTRTPATGNPFVNAPYSEPWQPTKEDTYSFAVEDVQKLGDRLDLVVGVSYDWTNLKEATDANVVVTGTTIANSVISFLPVSYELRDMDGVNGQAALLWRPHDNADLRASVSSRVRFPTLFERFSSRMGAAIPNPDVDPERSTNYEVGGTWNLPGNVRIDGAVFYSDVQDALVQIPVVLPAPLGTVNQTKNVASAQYFGAELSLDAEITNWLSVGGNVTLIERDYDQVPPASQVAGVTPPITGADPTNPNFEAQGVPGFKAFIYADWRVADALTLTPSVEFASERWTVTSSSAIVPPRFYETGDYVLLNLAATWDLNDHVSLLAGGKNLTDENYVLVDGFPEEGRSFYLSLRLRS
jgi:iron complex outermembrane receptor protein